jgi:hypothetical protein
MAVQDPEHNTAPALRVISGRASSILGVVVTLATIDWGMSTQAAWFSTMYGLLFVAGMGLTTFAFMTVAVLVINRSGRPTGPPRRRRPPPPVALVARRTGTTWAT